MKKLLTILILLVSGITYSQQLNLVDTTKINSIKIAEDNSFYIIKNEISLIIDDNLKRKIEFYRRDFDYIWKPEDGLEILIYKK